MNLDNFGKLIVFEGIDGSGTTSQAKELCKKLNNSVFTKEPSDTPIGQLTRELLKDTTYDVDRTSICLLFVADRIQHTKEFILPRLKMEKTIVCDRYLWSTLAYQAIYFGQEWLTELHRYDYISLPSLTILLDCDLDIAENRRQMRSDSVERYDDKEIQKRVRKNYLNLAKSFPSRSVVIDSNKDFKVVAQEIYDVVQRRVLNEHENTPIGHSGGAEK